MDPKDFLNSLLAKSGLTANSLANKLKDSEDGPVSQSVLSRFLSGKTAITYENARRIGKPLRFDPQALLDEAVAEQEAGRLGLRMRVESSGNVGLNQMSYLPTSTVYPYSDKNMFRAPVVEWARLGTDLFLDNRELVADEYEAVPASAKRNAKWFKVDRDHPRFLISSGDLLLVTPVASDEGCKEMKLHVFRSVAGDHFIGQFRRLAAGYEAIPDNGPSLESEKHGIRVVGVKSGHIEI